MNTDCVSCFSIPVIKIPRPLAEGSLFWACGSKGLESIRGGMAAEAGCEVSRLDPQTRSREKGVEMTQAP